METTCSCRLSHPFARLCQGTSSPAQSSEGTAAITTLVVGHKGLSNSGPLRRSWQCPVLFWHIQADKYSCSQHTLHTEPGCPHMGCSQLVAPVQLRGGPRAYKEKASPKCWEYLNSKQNSSSIQATCTFHSQQRTLPTAHHLWCTATIGRTGLTFEVARVKLWRLSDTFSYNY